MLGIAKFIGGKGKAEEKSMVTIIEDMPGQFVQQHRSDSRHI